MKLMLMTAAIIGMTLLISLAQDKLACAGGGCCCLLADGTECCTYDLNCVGCPCGL